MKKVTAYEVLDHGFDAPDYFQGCGTAFTEFDDVVTGTGDTAREAYEDALESLAQGGWDVASVRGKSALSRQTVRGFLRSQGFRGAEVDDSEMRAYVSIRVR